MMAQKPKIGLLGIMQELYDKTYPDITTRQEAYAREVGKQLEDVAEIHFPGAARNRNDIEKYVRLFNHENLDGIMIVMLTYGPSLRTIKAFQENHLPVLLANIQPLQVVGDEWDMSHLTFNQGIHGAQDTANALIRNGTKFSVVTDDFKSPSFKNYVSDWAHAAKAVQTLKSTKVAIFGQMPGMGDILNDSATFMRTMGPQIDHLSLGKVHKYMESISQEQIDKALQEDNANFQIDQNLTVESHSYALRLQLAIEAVLKEGDYRTWSIYFDAIGHDGRFKQIHMLAASNLMAKGYGYAAEGDANCASLMAAGFAIGPNPHFTEMYAMDFERDSALQSHMGEGNWKVARKDRPVRLIDRPLGIGGLDNPPTVLFQAEPGPATLVSLVTVKEGGYRLVASRGNILDTKEMPNVEMPYFHFRPENGIRSCMNGWLQNGGTHHQVLHLGDKIHCWQLFAELKGIEFVQV